jgi:hypothetical protein
MNKRTSILIDILILTIGVSIITCSCSPPINPCPSEDFNTIVLYEELLPLGGDLYRRIYTEWAIYGLSVNNDTITRQPLDNQPCYWDEIYGPDWVRDFKPD